MTYKEQIEIVQDEIARYTDFRDSIEMMIDDNQELLLNEELEFNNVARKRLKDVREHLATLKENRLQLLIEQSDHNLSNQVRWGDRTRKLAYFGEIA